MVPVAGAGRTTIDKDVRTQRFDLAGQRFVVKVMGDGLKAIEVDVVQKASKAGQSLSPVAVQGRSIGFVFQSFNLIPTLTAAENVMLAPTVVNKVSKAEARSSPVSTRRSASPISEKAMPFAARSPSRTAP